jgi:hypothetical protein
MRVKFNILMWAWFVFQRFSYDQPAKETKPNQTSKLAVAQRPSWEVNSSVPIQEIPSILQNPKIHHHVHNNPSLVPTLSQINSIHTLPSCVFKVQFSINLPPTFVSSE